VVSRKSIHIFKGSVERYFAENEDVYYWTFTFHDNVTDKAEAEKRFKPFRDRVTKRGGSMIGVWEKQKRGAWHVHVLINYFENVNEIRPWMVARGWGQMCKVERVMRIKTCKDGKWETDRRSEIKIWKYLIKYLCKGKREIQESACMIDKKKKLLIYMNRCKVGTTRFSWMPSENPASMIYYWGKRFYFELWRKFATFRQYSLIMKLGAEYLNYYDEDPFYLDP